MKIFKNASNVKSKHTNKRPLAEVFKISQIQTSIDVPAVCKNTNVYKLELNILIQI